MMNPTHFASGESMFNAKNRNQALPSWGEKHSEVCGSWLEEKQVEARLQDRQEFITELRVARKDQLASGRWIKESKMVQLVQQSGTFWEYMGVETDIGRCLYPEEAIFLIEMGEIEVTHGGMPMSVQSAQAVMLQDGYHLDQYHVYAHLARTGCKLVRHQPHLRFTRYEKQLRLDQHQAKKRKRKLKLKNDVLEVQDVESHDNKPKEVKKLPPCDPEKEVEVVQIGDLDNAMKEFYSSLGDGEKQLSETKKKQSDVSEISMPPINKKFREEKEFGSTSGSDKLNDYERKKKEYLDMFPSMLGTNVQVVKIEDLELFPESVEPQKRLYEVSLEVLNYFSRYFEDEGQREPQQYGRNRGRGKFRGMHSRDDYKFHGSSNRQGSYNNNRDWSRGRNNGRYGHSGWGASSSRSFRDYAENDREKCGSWDSRQGNETTWSYDKRNQESRIDGEYNARGRRGRDIKNDGEYAGTSNRGIGEYSGSENRMKDNGNFTASRRMPHDNWNDTSRSENNSEWRGGCAYKRQMEGLDSEGRWNENKRNREDRWGNDERHTDFRQMENRRMAEGLSDNMTTGVRRDVENNENYANNSRLGTNERFPGNRRMDGGNWQDNRRENEWDWRDNSRKGDTARVDNDGRWEENKRLQGHRWGDHEGHVEHNRRSDIDEQRMNMYGGRPMQSQGGRINENEWNDNSWNSEGRGDSNRPGVRAGWDDNIGGDRNPGYNRYLGEEVRSGNKRIEEAFGIGRDDGPSNEDRLRNTDSSRKLPSWLQHDDRWASPSAHDSGIFTSSSPETPYSSSSTQGDCVSSSKKPEKPTLDLSVVPQWKNKRRKRRWNRDPDTYPSFLVKLPVEVHSWREYKNFINSKTEDNILTQGLGRDLWKGPSTPLLKPAMATTFSNVLKSCLLADKKDLKPGTRDTFPPELQLTLHFDAYLPSCSFKKSSPSIPSKRITVIRDGVVPSLKQIQEVTKRFPDEAPVVSAIVIAGEVRLYTLSPITLPPPRSSW